VTGGPGAGKTSLLEALAARGQTYVPENARAVIQERRRLGLPPRPSPDAFASEILRRDIEQYREHRAHEGPVFFDRAIPDALGMLNERGRLAPGEAERCLVEHPYDRGVLLLPPWEAIYRTDAERDQTFEESVRVHEAVREWYVQCGFEPIEVPRGPIEERRDFVLRHMIAIGSSKNLTQEDS